MLLTISLGPCRTPSAVFNRPSTKTTWSKRKNTPWTWRNKRLFLPLITTWRTQRLAMLAKRWTLRHPNSKGTVTLWTPSSLPWVPTLGRGCIATLPSRKHNVHLRVSKRMPRSTGKTTIKTVVTIPQLTWRCKPHGPATTSPHGLPPLKKLFDSKRQRLI